MPSRFLCVVTRVRDEANHLRDFVPHYFEEGADHIMILDDRSSPPVARTWRERRHPIYGAEL